MKCRKEIVLTGYRVQYIDLREPKPRTPKETVHVMDRQWLDALGLTGQSATGNIRDQYEQAATERAVQAQIEKQLEKAVSKALDDIFKDWK